MKKIVRLILTLIIAIAMAQVVAAVPFDKSDAKYTDEQSEIIDDFYHCVTGSDAEVSIRKDDIWCSDRSTFGTYLIVCKAEYGSTEIYLTARYATYLGEFQMYSLQSSLKGLLRCEMEAVPLKNENEPAEPYLQQRVKAYALALFPDAEIGNVSCIKSEKSRYYTLMALFRIDGVPHAVIMDYEFQGDGEFYRDEDFHLFEVRVDGELMFEEDRVFG